MKMLSSKNNIILTTSLLLGGGVLLPLTSNAASSTSNVGGSTVNEGLLSTELRLGFNEDDDSSSSDKRFRMREHVDYGFNDWYALRILTAQDKREGDNLEHQSFTIENRFQLIEKKDYGWDGGFRLSYSQSDGDKTPHEVELRLVAETAINDKWTIKHNTVIEHDIGEDSVAGISVELRHRLTRKFQSSLPYVKSFELGLDMFNDFGNLRELSGYEEQDHQLGPVVKVSFDNGFSVQSTYRTAISSEGVDDTYGLFFQKKF